MATSEIQSVDDRNVSRRSLLQLALATAGVAAGGPLLAKTGVFGNNPFVQQGGIEGTVISGSSPMTGPNVTQFIQPLTIPRVITGNQSRTITQVREYQQILPEKDPAAPGGTWPKTKIYGYNGTYPGPTIEQTQGGAYTVVTMQNKRDDGKATSTHLHGSPTQPAHDGHPDDLTYPSDTTSPPLTKFQTFAPAPVSPTRPDGTACMEGEYKSYVGQHVYKYPNHQESRTLWYHDHAMHETAKNVYGGLVGMFIQRPANSGDEAMLPKGEFEVPLIIGDAQFDSKGNLAYDDKGHDSLWGNVIMVNGRAWPYMEVQQRKYRFRVLVADLSRGYLFRFSSGSMKSNPVPFQIIGTDAGLLRYPTDPTKVKEWRHGMAERYEVVVDFSKSQVNEEFILLNAAASGKMGQVMKFIVRPSSSPDTSSVPAELNTSYRYGEEAGKITPGTPTRYFKFERTNGEWVINGLTWDGKVAANPKVDTIEKWVLENKSGGWFHPIHIHLVDFQIIKRTGGANQVFDYEKGWKDVVYVGPNERVELVMRFNAAKKIDDKKPETGRYVMHCHNLIHEDNDMMTQFSTAQGDVQTRAASTTTSSSSTTLASAETDHAARGHGRGHSMMVQWQLEPAAGGEV